MTKTEKKRYVKPRVSAHGSVEEVTGWVGGGCGEFLGGTQGTNWGFACHVNGPGSFGS